MLNRTLQIYIWAKTTMKTAKKKAFLEQKRLLRRCWAIVHSPRMWFLVNLIGILWRNNIKIVEKSHIKNFENFKTFERGCPLWQYRKWTKENLRFVYCISITAPQKVSKSFLHEQPEENISSWATWRKLNLLDGFDIFRFLKLLNLKR